MDQDDDDDDDDDDDGEDGRSFENAGFRAGHGSDHDMDMEFMGDSKFGRYNDERAADGADDGDSEGSGSSYPHPPQPLSGYNSQHHAYQQHYQQYGQSTGWQDSGQGVGAGAMGSSA
jgi:hypothetical protein